MKGETPDKTKGFAFSLSPLFRHFPAKRHKQVLWFKFFLPRDS